MSIRPTRAMFIPASIITAFTLLNMPGAQACGMTAAPAPQGPAIQFHADSVHMGRVDTPAVLVQTDVLNPGTAGAVQQNDSESLCLIDGDGLVSYDPEMDPKVIKCKVAADKAQKRFRLAKQKYQNWLNKLPKQTREKLQKQENDNAQKQKEYFEKVIQQDRTTKGYFNADDDLRDAEKKFNDPDEKNKPTQKEIDEMRQDVKEKKESLKDAKAKAAEAGKAAEKAEADLKETMSKAFPGKEAQYETDKNEFEDAQKQADKADAKLKDARETAMKN